MHDVNANMKEYANVVASGEGRLWSGMKKKYLISNFSIEYFAQRAPELFGKLVTKFSMN